MGACTGGGAFKVRYSRKNLLLEGALWVSADRIDRAGVPSAVAAPRLAVSRVEVDHLGQRGANVEPEEAAAVRRLGVQDVQVKAVQLPAVRDDEPRHAGVTE
ncbi:hypothetical protein JG688_00016901 [Phytophthora aleatoria]|uniref:Uncharacterized protein n=1 Tax=Phytophthora aleatoria TaxID=2496075 RepID=A0A8J5IEU9_9STRA|nr:hypothetical protein JG688_00016901 [Phytophthora aleatoria]